jgi:hypothetical protein
MLNTHIEMRETHQRTQTFFIPRDAQRAAPFYELAEDERLVGSPHRKQASEAAFACDDGLLRARLL